MKNLMISFGYVAAITVAVVEASLWASKGFSLPLWILFISFCVLYGVVACLNSQRGVKYGWGYLVFLCLFGLIGALMGLGSAPVVALIKIAICGPLAYLGVMGVLKDDAKPVAH